MYTDSQGNIYFDTGVFIGSIPAVTGNQTKVLVPGPGGRVSSASVTQLITQSGGSIVSSVFGRTGVVTSQDGDYSSHQITETTNLYFTNDRARLALNITTFGTSGAATYDNKTGILNIPQYGGGLVGSYVPVTRTITINGQTADLSSDRIFSVDSMVYPSVGIPLSNGTSWGTSITNNSANWNTAYGWGNHASAGYLTSYTETDPIWTADKVNYYTKTQSDAAFATIGHTHSNYVINGVSTNIANAFNASLATAGLYMFDGYGASVPNGPDSSWNQMLFHIGNASRGLQIAGSYDNSNLYFRKGNTTWQTWKQIATTSYVDTAVANLVNSAPTTLDTLKELADALGGDANFSTTITTLIGTKEPAITAGSTTQYWRGDKTWQTLPVYTLSGLGGVPTSRTITINGTAYDLSADRSWSINSMVYPGVGIAVSTGTAWGTSIVDNSANWNSAYTDRMKWDGGATGLVAATGRTSLGLGSAAVAASSDFAAASHTHTIANVTSLQTALDGKEPSITAGTTAQYWRGDKTWQTLPSYSLPIASATVLGGIKVGTNLSIDVNGVLSSSYVDTNTWNANSKDVAGYVAAPGAVANKVWKTDASGNPAWRDDADTVYTLPTATGSVLGGVKIGNGINISSGVISNYIYDTRNTRGATRLYRREEDTDYSVQTYWTGAHWYLRGYSGDTFHAETRVGYSDSTGSVAWGNVSGRPTAVSSFTNDASYITSASNVAGLYINGYGTSCMTYYQSSGAFAGYNGWAGYFISNHGDGSNYYNQTIIMPFWGPPQYSRREANTLRGPYGFITDENIGGQSVAYASSAGNASTVGGYSAGTFVFKSGDTMSGRLTVDTRSGTNLPLYVLATEPYIQLEAVGATNSTSFRMYPSGGYNALIGNYSSGQLVLVAGNTESVYITSDSLRVAKYRFNGNSTLSGNGTPEIVDMASVGMAMQALNYRWYNNAASVIMMTLDSSGNLTANAFYESSDIRYKNVIETNPSLTLEGLDVIKFTRKGSTTIRYGYSAQQVKSLSEDLIGGTKDEMTVNYSDVHTLKIAALEKRIGELEAKLNNYGI